VGSKRRKKQKQHESVHITKQVENQNKKQKLLWDSHGPMTAHAPEFIPLAGPNRNQKESQPQRQRYQSSTVGSDGKAEVDFSNEDSSSHSENIKEEQESMWPHTLSSQSKASGTNPKLPPWLQQPSSR
jgi:hypothetical protein